MRYAKTLGLIVAVALAAGCGQPEGKPKADGGKADGGKAGGKKKPHAHGKGPNGGVVIDLGKYHAEIDIKHDKGQLIVLFLDGDNEDAKPLAVACKELTVVTKEAKGEKGEKVKPMTITLKPADEKDGKASRFVGTDPGLEVKAEHEGTVFGDIDGKRAEKEFKEE